MILVAAIMVGWVLGFLYFIWHIGLWIQDLYSGYQFFHHLTKNDRKIKPEDLLGEFRYRKYHIQFAASVSISRTLIISYTIKNSKEYYKVSFGLCGDQSFYPAEQYRPEINKIMYKIIRVAAKNPHLYKNREEIL